LGDGTQIRHYTYGADLARGIVMSLDHPGALNEDFNLSTAEETSVNELAAVIWSKINGDRPLSLVYDTPFDHDVQRRSPSTSKAQEVLGFEATTSLSDMLDIVIPWIDDAISQGAI
jgi:nucleoside-diphosphate-sugar epimerase